MVGKPSPFIERKRGGPQRKNGLVKPLSCTMISITVAKPRWGQNEAGGRYLSLNGKFSERSSCFLESSYRFLVYQTFVGECRM